MEITLEKIELVKDRTGVSYKEAKEALEAADGSVVDAIIAIEETVDVKPGAKANAFAAETVAKIKDFVRKGNISKITVQKGDTTIVNVPVNVGVVGAIVAPWGGRQAYRRKRQGGELCQRYEGKRLCRIRRHDGERHRCREQRQGKSADRRQ